MRASPSRTGAAGAAMITALLLAACGGTESRPTDPGATRPDTVDVFTPGNIFSPTAAEIRVGGTVRWRISESPDRKGHNVIFNAGAAGRPADVPVVKDTTVLRTFRTAGSYPYRCTVHPGMDGDVVVR